MFTAIIPTMWRSPRIVKLLEDLNASPYVGEIIVIDNDPKANSLPPKHEKITIVTGGENMFVNPSWNYGAGQAKYEHLAILNDDVSFDVNALLKPNTATHHLSYGAIVGMASESYMELQPARNIKKDLTISTMQERPYGWGCIMLIAKANYVPIPDDLLIANGDDWLAQNATPYVLHGLKIESEISTTSREPQFGMQQLADNKLFDEKYRK